MANQRKILLIKYFPCIKINGKYSYKQIFQKYFLEELMLVSRRRQEQALSSKLKVRLLEKLKENHRKRDSTKARMRDEH